MSDKAKLIDKLLNGFSAFRDSHYCGHNALMPRLVEEGQDPDYFIISCIDSRSNPGTVFNTAPGTFFAHKAMGAIVRPYQKGTALAAALQFAINYNNVKKIIVLGHTGCGAIRALVEKIDDEEIASFITVAKKGLEKARQNHACHSDDHSLFRHAEEQIALLSTENLKTYPSVKKALTEGKIEILTWLFDMDEGAILEYDEKTQKFIDITPPQEKRPELTKTL